MTATFKEAAGQHGIPAATLTHNGMVYTVRLAGLGRQGGRNGFEQQLHDWHVTQKNSRPNHPTTCGKVCEDLSLVLHRPGLTPAKV